MRLHAAPFLSLLRSLAANWLGRVAEFGISFDDDFLEVEDDHPLASELRELCSGHGASLPFWTGAEVKWCTLAPNGTLLRAEIAALQAWVIPSFAAEESEAYVRPGENRGALAQQVLSASPDGYFRWRCRVADFGCVAERLALRRRVEQSRPKRSRTMPPSRFELRLRFVASLLAGNREGAEGAIGLLDELHLETALNTLFMRVRLWHHFREFETIRANKALAELRGQALPPRVESWIGEAFGYKQSSETLLLPEVEASPPQPKAPEPVTWSDWFDFVKNADADVRHAAELFVEEKRSFSVTKLSAHERNAIVGHLEDLYLDAALRTREFPLLARGLIEMIGDYVREPDFPRPDLGVFYLALLQAWGALHAGNTVGKEHGHILLELADAALRLHQSPDEVHSVLRSWWDKRRSASLLPFVLDAVELLDREMPPEKRPYDLWTAAIEFLQRDPDLLTKSERDLWRKVGQRLGFSASELDVYLPQPTETEDVAIDILARTPLRHVAIVCMREQQAIEAADQISQRSLANVTVVTERVPGAQTDHARTADVILFVWMASTHAVFRAFDGFDRRRFCYVQGTGAASIVRTLERWVSD